MMQTRPLTEAQIEVLQLLAEGYHQKEIASRLFLSVGGVRVRIGTICRKLGAASTINAVYLAMKQGLLR